MIMSGGETIYALASGRLPTAVAIFRVSGPLALEWARRHFPTLPSLSERGMYFGPVKDGEKKIDDVVLLAFPGPRSLTGEDVIEIQCHGSLGVAKVLEESFAVMGIRPARRGEFSFRALSNGKMDPAKINELGDVFLAQEPGDLYKIYARKDRGLEREVFKLRELLIRLLAILDTAVDFSEEYSAVVVSALPLIQAIHQDIDLIIHRYSRFRSGSAASRIVLAGRPNAGKSSLFNALVGRYRAIVHERPGTTRDVIEEDVEIAGRRWKLVDTAGVRPVAGGVESQGMELGRTFLHGSAFWILVVDGAVGLRPEDRALLEEFGGIPHLIVWNKKDLPDWQPPEVESVAAEVLSLAGTQGLLDKLSTSLAALSLDHESVLPTATESAKLRHCQSELKALEQELHDDVAPEYLAERARGILKSLDLVMGEVTTEDVLDRVFGEFCIGK